MPRTSAIASIDPCRAPVVPRVRDGLDGEPLPIEDRARELLARGRRVSVNLRGPAGSGKTTALRHLASVLSTQAPVSYLDGHNSFAKDSRLDILTSEVPTDYDLVWYMAPWTNDDLIEYLLARWRHRCKAVMGRITADPGSAELAGSPQLWRIVLDDLAANDMPGGVLDVLCRNAADACGPWRLAEMAGHCLDSLTRRDVSITALLRKEHERVGKLLRHRIVQVLLAGDSMVYQLCDEGNCRPLTRRLPRDLLRHVADRLNQRPSTIDLLAEVASGEDESLQSTAVTILLSVRPLWRPATNRLRGLSGARLMHARWKGIDLCKARADDARFRDAELTGAKLTDAVLLQSRFVGADLRGAKMERVKAQSARFERADLSSAVLEGACLDDASMGHACMASANLNGAQITRADLRGADFRDATLQSADLRGARVSGANFNRADLSCAKLDRLRLGKAAFAWAMLEMASLIRCNMEGIEMASAILRCACLRHARLTGADLSNADLEKADLRGAKLADVNLSCAKLSKADLRHATFHMGSARSGLIPGAPASEGTRTGFYTDDYDDLHCKRPEEIRKANLTGADLRGARIKGVDFYLIDLRGAKYTDRQHRYFRKCGAILDEFR